MEALSSLFGLICIFCQKDIKHSGRIGRTGVQQSKPLTEDEQEQSEVQALQKSSASTHVDHKLQQDQLEDMRIFDGNCMSLLERSDS